MFYRSIALFSTGMPAGERLRVCVAGREELVAGKSSSELSSEVERNEGEKETSLTGRMTSYEDDFGRK